MQDEPTLKQDIDDYVDRIWEDAVADMGALIAIRSVEDLEHAAPGAPWGPQTRAALLCALGIAERLGLETCDMDGYLGYADLPGESPVQIATIAHCDIVPEGIGWTFDPFSVTRRDGYLVGRGIIDDKGPLVLSLYAAHFFRERGERLPYTLRCIIGADEETGMGDVPWYLGHEPQPAFLFTPDAEFPVCCGEKGGFHASITSAPISGGVIEMLDGGTVGNAVPGQATAVVRVQPEGLAGAPGIDVEDAGEGRTRLVAHGRGGHASVPDGTVNAIGMLVDYLLDNDLCSADERRFLELERRVFASTDGSSLGIAAADDLFDPLTCIGGTVRTRDGRFIQTIDSRYPTSITGERIRSTLEELVGRHGASIHVDSHDVPFYIDPSSPEIRTLVSSYAEYTGSDAQPFTIGGGTYARHFANAASFGPGDASVVDPSWVGTEHGADEGISEEQMRRALKIYILAISRLMQLDL